MKLTSEKSARRPDTRMILVLFTVLLIALASPVAAQQAAQDDVEKAREAVCQRVLCRPPTTVRLRLNDKEYFEMNFPKAPYVADGFINVLAGEEFNVEFENEGETLSNARYVKSPLHPERTVSWRLEQTEQGTMLTVKNPFTKDITYDCLIQHYSETRLRKTSIIPVRGGLMSFEMWPFPVAQIVVSNVRFTSKKDQTISNKPSNQTPR